MIAVVRLVARSRWRSRARSLLLLAVFIAIVGTVVLTAFTGARRTSSALDRLRSMTRDPDFTVTRYDNPGFADGLAARLRASGVVTGAVTAAQSIAIPDGADQAKNADFTLAYDPNGHLGYDVQRPLLVAGRRPNASSANEVLLDTVAAHAFSLEVGNHLRAKTFTPEDVACFSKPTCTSGAPHGPRVDLLVVGIGRTASDVRATDGSWGLTTPAFARKYAATIGRWPSLTFVRLPAGPAARPTFLRELHRLAGPTAQLGVYPSDYVKSSQRTLDALTTALAAFGLVAAAAGLVALGQAVNREVASAAETSSTLDALGITRAGRTGVIVGALAPTIAAGAVLAGLGSFLASPLMPVGYARTTEPHPGFAFDALVIVAGTVALVAVVGTVAVLAAWRASAIHDRRSARVQRSAIGATAARVGAPPAPVIGIRFAFEPTGRSTARVRSAVIATVFAVTGVVGTAVIVASTNTLVASPARWGTTWSSRPDLIGPIAETVTGIRTDRHIAAAARLTHTEIEIGDELGFGYAISNVKGNIQPTIRRGRAPETDHEIAIGERTLHALRAEIGDTVRATAADGRSYIPLRVVGAAVIPTIDNDDAGTGAFLTPQGLRTITRGDNTVDTVLRYAPGMARATEAQMARHLKLNYTIYARPEAPSSVQNLHRIIPIFVALALFFAFLGIAGIGHGLTTSTRRRHRDLAMLRVFGFRKRQVRHVIDWQATAIALTGVLVGIPLGLIVGREVWNAIVNDFGVLDAATTPWWLLIAMVPLTIASAALIARRPAAAAARSRPASDLRAE